MRVAVELTYDDFAEATAAVRAAVMEKQRRKARGSPWKLVSSIAIACVLVFVATLAWRADLDPYSYQRPPLYAVITMMLPFVIVGVFTVVLAVMYGQRTGKFLVGVIGWLLFFGMLVVLLWLLRSVQPVGIFDGDRSDPDWFGTLVPHMPWVIITAAFAALLIRSIRDQTKLSWEAYAPHLRRKIYDITAEGVSVDEGVSRAQYAWAAFSRVQETANLMLLCPTDLTFEILPKRAFASAEDLNAARHLFTALIRDPSTEPAGFAVHPHAGPNIPTTQATSHAQA